ncbi:MAG: outer membrane lipid asymmetry maintenance protein MlaD [Robiginitomaculum sp.]|nr:outer membrane lipid asymmetry maintenance protein MlaD [Robiginitomaculum sp.]
MKDQLTETIVGLFVLLVAIGFSVYVSSTIGSGRQGSAVDLIANFSSAGGVATGTDIRLAGVKIGTVTDISLDTNTYEARVTLNVRADVPVPEDSVAKIVSDGLLGSAYIAIEPGADEEMMAAGASFEYTQGSVDLLGLLGQFAGGSSNENPKDASAE